MPFGQRPANFYFGLGGHRVYGYRVNTRAFKMLWGFSGAQVQTKMYRHIGFHMSWYISESLNVRPWEID